MDLFYQNQAQDKLSAPLAEKVRPHNLSELVGQTQFLRKYQGVIEQFRQGHLLSLILWGPPGCGKTSFVKALTSELQSIFLVEENAIDLGAKKLKEIGERARDRRRIDQQTTLVFIDEIHRLNRAQQDVLLPFVEKGDVILMGATTENPSYELNSALVSRCRIIVFEPLDEKSLGLLLERGCSSYELSPGDLFEQEALDKILLGSAGDGRKLLNTLEELILIYKGDSQKFPLSAEAFDQLNLHQGLRYDKGRDEHYDTISAFIKSIRGSDPDAGIYYLARMLEGGEDPVFIARRLVILASEDVGNADPNALPLAVAALQAVELVGMPEARINLAQAVTYMASAPKSNRSYQAINKAMEAVKSHGALPIPKALRSAQTKLSKQLGHGKDYKYSHEGQKGWLKQTFLPEEIKDEVFYEPAERGFEKRIREYLNWMKS